MKKEVVTQAMMLYQKKFGGRLVDISIMFANVIEALVEAEEAAKRKVSQMEFYERAAKLGVPDIHITEEEWQKHYNNSYSVLALDGSDVDKILAAQDIIKTYLVLQAEEAAQQGVQSDGDFWTCPQCNHGNENAILLCNFCHTPR